MTHKRTCCEEALKKPENPPLRQPTIAGLVSGQSRMALKVRCTSREQDGSDRRQIPLQLSFFDGDRLPDHWGDSRGETAAIEFSGIVFNCGEDPEATPWRR